ncbi:MAG: response regulator [Hyphomicrobiaceae bacterium]
MGASARLVAGLTVAWGMGLAAAAVLLPALSLLPRLLLLATGVGVLAAGILAFRRGEAHDEAGSPAGLDKVAALGERLERSIENLKDIQWQLKENEARYRDLLDNQQDVILRRDGEGVLTFVNNAFCRAFGVDRERVLGRPFAPRVLEGEASPPAFGDGGRRRYVQQVVTSSGPRWFVWEDHIVTGEEGRSSETQSVGRDITEQRRAELDLQDARTQAEQASRAKSRFLAAMSHEIRTPMAGILGMTELLSDTQQTAEQRNYCFAIEKSAKTLLMLIDEILDFSKVEAGKLVLNEAEFRLDESVQTVVELLYPRAREKGLELAWSIDPALPAVVVGDETRIRQILINLVGNAIKFTDRGGVSLAVRAAEGEPSGDAAGDDIAMAMTVRDTGIGLASDSARTMFAEFEQGEAARRGQRGGTGLGLAISERLARAMGGRITVESRPGAGAAFTAMFAVRRVTTAGALADTWPHVRERRRVAIVSPRRIESETLCQVLSRCGHDASVFGATDVAAASTWQGDVLLVDASEPADDAGAWLAALRRSLPGDVRGICLLEAGARAPLAAYRAAGFDAYLVRPVRPASLLAQIDGLVLREDAGSPVAIAQQRPKPRQHARRRILLAEDNDINALLARRVLEKSGCEVVLAENGHAAVQCAMQALTEGPQFDLILMDIQMPGLDGFDAARAIRSAVADMSPMPRLPPMVALTANAFAEDRKRCLDAGLDDYLAKPFARHELEAMLERWCGDELASGAHGRIGNDAA